MGLDQIVKDLLKAGADINTTNLSGAAARNGFESTVALLLTDRSDAISC